VFLDQRDPALHVVDEGTTYQAAMLLEGEGFVPVWNSSVKCWTRAYVGDPESITVDKLQCLALERSPRLVQLTRLR
jgi:hypothetical protein